MTDKNEWNFVAPCGLYCEECTAFLNSECGGCRSNKGLSEKYNKYCKIYQCSSDKNLKICVECKDSPCKFFDFFKAETLESSSWFIDVWHNMKQVREIGLTEFLTKKRDWLRKRKECAKKRNIKYCDECKQWPCELIKRPILVPADLEGFKEFMKKCK
jgi:hypothetical protein